MKHVLRAGLVILVTLLTSIIGWVPTESLLSTLFTVTGIFFSIGYSVIISFNMAQVTNRVFIARIKNNLKALEDTFLVYFAVAVIAFLVSGSNLSISYKATTFRWSTLSAVTSSLVLIYFIINYRELHKLKEEINDRTREEITKDIE